MRTTLIAPTPPDVAAFGVRTLSAYLKKHGKDVRVIFLPGGVESFKYQEGFRYKYEDAIIEQLIELCRGSGLLGLSFMSNYLDRAMQLTSVLQEALDIPLVLGGVHPTVMPEESLQLADIVCVGEGEEALLELVTKIEAGEDFTGIKNLYVKRDGEIIRNLKRPLVQDLDSLPFFDFGLDEHYIYDNTTGRLEPMTLDLLERSFPMEPHIEGSFNDSYTRTKSYKTMTTRGCPHHCTFCAEKALADIYPGEKYLRRRSVPNVIEELLWVKENLPFVESIFLFDDVFLARPTPEIVEFGKQYKEKIGMPFHIQASPSTVTDERIDALVDAGMVFVEMGIQSTSQNGKELYKRKTSERTILKAADVLAKHLDRISPPCYHVILDNPWESPEDTAETLRTVTKLPRPFWLKRASLVCFPGTELYYKAKADGIIKTEEDEWREIYAKHLHTPKGTYLNILMYLAGFSYFPRWIVNLLAHERLISLLNRGALSEFYLALNRLGEMLIVVNKGIKSVFRGDFDRIARYVSKLRSKTA